MNANEYDPFVLAITKKAQITSLCTNRLDVDEYTKSIVCPGLPKYLSVFAEDKEVVDAILDEEILQILDSDSSRAYFEELVISDQPGKSINM